MKNKQTAVEWLIEELNSNEYRINHGKIYISKYLIQEAKQLEKEQINRAYGIGYGDRDTEIKHSVWLPFDEDNTYYDQTFKKEK